MSEEDDDYAATVPAELRSEPTVAPVKAPPAFIPMPMPMPEHSNRKLRIAFTGSGSEYFRIWIVNLLLILVTFGLYFPWAKVRRLRYFYGNTVVDGEPLGFHGNAFKMFKGFLIVAAFFALYSVAGKVSPAAGFVAFLAIAALWPALLKSSMQFRMANTSWRGLRFGFSGSLRDAYAACLPLFVPGVLILGVMLMAPELQEAAPAKAPSGMWLSVFGAVMLFALVITPWLMWNLKRYQHNHYHLGQETTQFSAPARSYYWLCLKVIGVAFLIYLLLIAVVVGGVLGAGALSMAGKLPKGPMGQVLIGVASVFFSLLAFAAIKPYAVARFQNLVWNGTRSAHMQFISSLRARHVIALSFKNWILMLLTLGLYWPFASIAMARLRLQAVQVVSTLSPSALVAATANAEGQATGDAAGDFFGFDIGL
ncbi:MAG: hypothetical protein CFE43_19565 [Burkholderiales bacterium PBB3]|nr:MAG: hypothetical protein CFE43_19565 [Burkholderiales bacterium PBB3]